MFMPKNNYPYGSVRIVKLKLLWWQNGNLGNFMSSQSWFRGECFYFIVQCHANVTLTYDIITKLCLKHFEMIESAIDTI